MNKYLLVYGQNEYRIIEVEYNLDYECLSWNGNSMEMPIAIIHLTDEMINDISKLVGENNE